MHLVIKLVVILIISFALVIYRWFASKTSLKKGDKAPLFTLLDSDGIERSLTDFQGQYVVLYFFPKQSTPGCTKQACALRDNYAIFADQDIQVIGVSYDTVASLASFKQNEHLPFLLLSDAKKEVAALYGANRFWLINIVPKRMTFIIDKRGIILDVMPEVTVATHVTDVLARIKAVHD